MARVGTDQELTARLQERGPALDIRGHGPALTERIIEEITRSIPVFGNAGEPFIDITRLVVGRIVDQALLLFLEQRLPTRQEVRELVEVCVPPTDQGVTLEDLLTVFRISQDVLWWELHRLVDDDALAHPQSALELSQLGVSLITDLSRGVTSQYLRGDRVWLQRRDAERALIDGILGSPPKAEQATRAANALDLRLFGTWRVAAYRPVGRTSLDQLLTQLEDQRMTWGVRGALAIHGGIVVLATQDDPHLPPPTDARVGVGNPGEGAQGMRTSHDEARDALAVAERTDLTELTVDDARLGRVVLGSLSAAELADAVLAPIEAEPEGRRDLLMETLEAWLDEQGSATATARRLQLHVQSARYRITQLREVLGDVLEDPDQRLLLHLACRARHLT